MQIGRKSGSKLPLAISLKIMAGIRISPLAEWEKVCKCCRASNWTVEASVMCCSKAKGRLTALQTPPDVLMQLLTEDTLKAKHFCGTN